MKENITWVFEAVDNYFDPEDYFVETVDAPDIETALDIFWRHNDSDYVSITYQYVLGAV